MKRSHIIAAGFTFVSANFSVMLINYGFHIVTANQLSAPSYGLMSALMAVFAVVAYISIGLQTKCADLAAKSYSNRNYDLAHEVVRYWLKISIFVSIAIAMIMLIFSTYIANQLHASQLHIILISVAIMTVLPLSCLRGFLLGKENYFGLSLNMVIESLAKFIAAYLVLKAGHGLAAVIATIICGQIVGIGFALMSIRYHAVFKKTKKPQLETLPAWLMTVYFACFAIWTTLDVVVVQIFQPDDAGAYSVATRIGQVVLFGLTTMTTFLYPKFSVRSADILSFRQLFLPTVLVFLVVGLIAIFTIFELREFVVITIFGMQYENAVNWLAYICISALGLSLAHLSMHFMIAQANRHIVFLYCLFTLMFSAVIFLSAMRSTQSLVFTMMAANWLLFAAMFLYAFGSKKTLTSGAVKT
ncbi:MAG: O-antigen/teichoic acid export membrane protein [Arenicella sp.]